MSESTARPLLSRDVTRHFLIYTPVLKGTQDTDGKEYWNVANVLSELSDEALAVEVGPEIEAV